MAGIGPVVGIEPVAIRGKLELVRIGLAGIGLVGIELVVALA